MERLISLREFIVEPKHWKDTEHFDNHDVLSLIISYANFLSQPLTLSMFVPCDEEGNVLEEPIEDNYNLGDIHSGFFRKKLDEYNQAKNRVLFEGFTWDKNGECLLYDIKNGDAWMLDENDMENETVETFGGIEYSVTLTAIAQKQIFG